MLKLTLLTLFLFSSCATQPPLVKPLTKKSLVKVKKPRRVSANPKDLITHFYEDYFTNPKETEAPLSKALANLNQETDQLCQQKAQGEVCGWNANGDPYLDAQDFSDKLNLKTSQLKVETLRGSRVKARFNIFPDLAHKNQYQREITYRVIKENGHWVIDDIFYPNNRSARKSMLETQRSLQDKSFSLPKILAFSKSEKLKTNIKSIKKDVSFNSYKVAGKNLNLSLKAFPGPERFNQLSLSCDHCGISEISLDQTLLCQSSFKGLYRKVVSTKNNDELSTLFKQARFEEGIKISLPEAGHEMRIETSPLKCDGLGGQQIRIDIFIN